MEKIGEHLKRQFGGQASSFSIVRFRGDPNMAVLATGETVTKQEYIYVKTDDNRMHALRCADYHGEHFIYADPKFNEDGEAARGHWFAMCTCGSPAVKIGTGDVLMTHGEGDRALVVCYVYMLTLQEEGVGSHMTGHRKWW